MAKYIRLTDSKREELMKRINEERCTSRGFSISDDMKAPEQKAEIYYTEEAWIKSIMLVDVNNDEVGWYGVCKRGEQPNVFVVEDLLPVYPQEVTGANIDPDPIEFVTWENEIPDDEFKNMRIHVHSHVRMATTPSGTDMQFRRDKLSQMGDSDFYVFQIMNKSGSVHSEIYDMAKNIVFENDDIKTYVMCDSMDKWESYKEVARALLHFGDAKNVSDVALLCAGYGIVEFLADAAKKVKKKTYTYKPGKNWWTGKKTSTAGKRYTTVDDTVSNFKKSGGGASDAYDDAYDDVYDDPFCWYDGQGYGAGGRYFGRGGYGY